MLKKEKDDGGRKGGWQGGEHPKKGRTVRGEHLKKEGGSTTAGQQACPEKVKRTVQGSTQKKGEDSRGECFKKGE